MNIYKAGRVGLMVCVVLVSALARPAVAVAVPEEAFEAQNVASEALVYPALANETVLNPTVVKQTVVKQTDVKQSHVKQSHVKQSHVRQSDVEQSLADKTDDQKNKIGLYLYAQATNKSQRTRKKFSPSSLRVVSLALDWIEVRSKTKITAWVPINSVEIVDQKTVRTSTTAIVAYFRNLEHKTANRNNRLPLLLAPSSHYTVVSIEASSIELEVSPTLSFWVKSQDYLVASQLENTHQHANSVGLNSLEEILPPEKRQLQDQGSYLSWLCEQVPTEKTLQLVSFRDPAEIAAYLGKHPELDASKLVRAHSEDLSWHYLLYGNYPNQAGAEAEIKQLQLNRKSTSIRGIGYLQSMRCPSETQKLS